MAAVNNNNSFARAHNVPADALWRSTAKPMFDYKMADWGKFDNIALSDLRGDNSILLMTQFCQRVANDPPINRTTKAPQSNDLNGRKSWCVERAGCSWKETRRVSVQMQLSHTQAAFKVHNSVSRR